GDYKSVAIYRQNLYVGKKKDGRKCGCSLGCRLSFSRIFRRWPQIRGMDSRRGAVVQGESLADSADGRRSGGWVRGGEVVQGESPADSADGRRSGGWVLGGEVVQGESPADSADGPRSGGWILAEARWCKVNLLRIPQIRGDGFS